MRFIDVWLGRSYSQCLADHDAPSATTSGMGCRSSPDFKVNIVTCVSSRSSPVRRWLSPADLRTGRMHACGRNVPLYSPLVVKYCTCLLMRVLLSRVVLRVPPSSFATKLAFAPNINLTLCLGMTAAVEAARFSRYSQQKVL